MARHGGPAALAGHPLQGARLAIDERRGTTYDRFYVKPGFHGLPRFLLIDRAGRVRFEGDDEAALEAIKGQFRQALRAVHAELATSF